MKWIQDCFLESDVKAYVRIYDTEEFYFLHIYILHIKSKPKNKAKKNWCVLSTYKIYYESVVPFPTFNVVCYHQSCLYGSEDFQSTGRFRVEKWKNALNAMIYNHALFKILSIFVLTRNGLNFVLTTK